RLYRWVRRNPKVAGLLATLALVLVVGFTAVTWLWLLAEQRGEDLQRKTAEAERQRDRAEKNFDRVFKAVEESLVQVSRSKELKAAELRPFRRQLLDRALQQFQRFVEEIGDNPRAREALARSYLRVAEIHGAMGNSAEAVDHMQKGLEICRRLVEEQ